MLWASQLRAKAQDGLSTCCTALSIKMLCSSRKVGAFHKKLVSFWWKDELWVFFSLVGICSCVSHTEVWVANAAFVQSDPARGGTGKQQRVTHAVWRQRGVLFLRPYDSFEALFRTNCWGSSSFASWADQLLFFGRSTVNLKAKTEVRDIVGFICLPVSTSFLPYVSTEAQLSFQAGDAPIFQTSQFPSKSWPSAADCPAEPFWNWARCQNVAPWLSSALKKGLQVGQERQVIINVRCTEPPAVPLQISAVKCKKEVSLSPLSQETIPQHRGFWKGISTLMLAVKAEIHSPP